MYEYQRLTQNIQLGFYTSNYGTRYELSKMPKMEILLFLQTLKVGKGNLAEGI